MAAACSSSRQPVAIDRARIDRQIRELALEHAAGSLGDEAYLARLKVLRQQRDAVVERMAARLPAERALEWLRALGESLQATEKSKEKADLYDRITVAGPEIVPLIPTLISVAAIRDARSLMDRESDSADARPEEHRRSVRGADDDGHPHPLHASIDAVGGRGCQPPPDRGPSPRPLAPWLSDRR